MAKQTPMTSGALFVLVAAALWGTTGTASALAPGVSPLVIGAASMGLGGLLLLTTAARSLRAGWPRLRGCWGHALAGGVLVAVYALSFYTSMRLAGVAIGTAVSLGVAPLAAGLLERLLDGRRLRPRWAVATGLGTTGVVLLSFGREGSAEGTALLPGILLGVVAAAAYAGYSWTSHRVIGAGLGSRATMGATFGVAAVPLLTIVAVNAGELLSAPAGLPAVLYLAVIPMFVGYLFFGWGLARTGPGIATTVSLAEPVVATLLAVTVVGERLAPGGWAGMALILLSLLVLSAGRGR